MFSLKAWISISAKKYLTIGITFFVFAVSYLCLSNGIYIIYQNLFYIPIIFSCFWYREKGLIFSICISAAHFLYFLSYNPERLWEELTRVLVFIIIGFITYRLSASIKKQQIRIMQLNKRLNNDAERFNKEENGSIGGHIIEAIVNMIHEKTPRIEDHSKRVSQLCQEIGSAMNLSEKDINELRISGLLHDIGKIALDDVILNKTGKLTKEEWTEIKRHSDIGFKILNTSPDMSDIAQYILSHHERVDGKGYPGGITIDRIPLISRIIAVADAYDAMTNERVYRKALNMSMAIKELENNRGTQFDPDIVDIFVKKVLKVEIKPLNEMIRKN